MRADHHGIKMPVHAFTSPFTQAASTASASMSRHCSVRALSRLGTPRPDHQSGMDYSCRRRLAGGGSALGTAHLPLLAAAPVNRLLMRSFLATTLGALCTHSSQGAVILGSMDRACSCYYGTGDLLWAF